MREPKIHRYPSPEETPAPSQEAISSLEESSELERQKEIDELYEWIGARIGEPAAHQMREVTLRYIEDRTSTSQEIEQMQLDVLETFIEGIKELDIPDFLSPSKKKLLLRAMGMTLTSGEFFQPGILNLVERMTGDGDIFPNAQSRDLFMRAGETLPEICIAQSLLALRDVFEPHIVDALYSEIQLQVDTEGLDDTVNAVNNLLLLYVEELRLMAIRRPRTMVARVQFANEIGFSDDTEMKGVPNILGIEYNVRYARERGSIFQDKDLKRTTVESEEERSRALPWYAQRYSNPYEEEVASE
jgi:hypothetical protein